jgi:hypothetical protein
VSSRGVPFIPKLRLTYKQLSRLQTAPDAEFYNVKQFTFTKSFEVFKLAFSSESVSILLSKSLKSKPVFLKLWSAAVSEEKGIAKIVSDS